MFVGSLLFLGVRGVRDTKTFTKSCITFMSEKFQDNTILEKHLNTLVDFWDNILFYTGTYGKNAMQPHLLLHQKKPFSKIHFDTWLKLFNQSVDDNFKGENASVLKNRALSVATIMRIKTINS